MSTLKGTRRFIPPRLFLTDLGRFLADFAQIRARRSLMQLMKGFKPGFWINTSRTAWRKFDQNQKKQLRPEAEVSQIQDLALFEAFIVTIW